jgi:hypothetical protein
MVVLLLADLIFVVTVSHKGNNMSTKVHYGSYHSTNPADRIVPAPVISISNQPIYSNDHVIGYTHVITLNGYASAFVRDDTDTVDGDIYETEDGSGSVTTEYGDSIVGEDASISSSSATNEADANIKALQKVLSTITYVKNLLSKNGKFLTIRDDENNVIIVGKGGTLKSLSFSENENGWTAYSQYTAEIEFNEIEFMNEHIPCGSIYMDNINLNTNLVDFSVHKIKQFQDNWSFSIQDDAFGAIRETELGEDLDIHNSRINVSYSISATGKNYYLENETLIPAWQQAKNFCQSRLYDQIKSLIKNTLSLNDDQACSATRELNTINDYGRDGVLSDIDSYYDLYNETVNCDCSESEGQFSVEYSAVLKRKTFGDFDSSATIHTVSKTKNINKVSLIKNEISISITGNIQGLHAGGLIKAAGNFTIPKQGSFLILDSSMNKFTNALSLLNNITNGDDLTEDFKEVLGITFGELEVNLQACSQTPTPATFSVTRNFFDGSIDYNIEYNSTSSDFSAVKISVDVSNPVPVLAEFVVPNYGVIIQDIDTQTARKISYTIEGRTNKICCLESNGINNLISGYCGGIPSISGLTLPSEANFVLTDKKYSQNLIQGKFTLNLAYQCGVPCNV